PAEGGDPAGVWSQNPSGGSQGDGFSVEDGTAGKNPDIPSSVPAGGFRRGQAGDRGQKRPCSQWLHLRSLQAAEHTGLCGGSEGGVFLSLPCPGKGSGCDSGNLHRRQQPGYGQIIEGEDSLGPSGRLRPGGQVGWRTAGALKSCCCQSLPQG